MHVADGVLPTNLCLAAAGLAGVGVYALSRGIRPEEAPRIGMLAAAAFLASVVHFPVAGVSMHFGLYGLLGVLLGKRSFAVVAAALVLQTLLLQHGGIVSIGVNVMNMGVGALAAWGVWSLNVLPVRVRSFAAGSVGVMLPAVMMASEFYMADYGKGFFAITALYAVVAIAEGALTMALVDCFKRLKPEALATATA
jgi:cobalt/nickel transport system permease protein